MTGTAEPPAWILSAPYAGLRAQAWGLAEAAGLPYDTHTLAARWPWRHLPPALWPTPRHALPPEAARATPPGIVIGAGGMAAAVGAALRSPRTRIVQVQNPRMRLSRFDLVVANRHDEIAGPNVIVTRTALHRATPQRLAAAAHDWSAQFAHLPRPLVAVLVGGSNGRYRLNAPVGQALAASLAAMMRADRVGLAITPSRRTDPAVVAALRTALVPLGAYLWDAGDNPYFGLLALADAVVVTQDSISMVSEAVATRAPVLIARLPGRSRRQTLFLSGLQTEHRVRDFHGRLDIWPVTPLDDTPAAAAELRRRLYL